MTDSSTLPPPNGGVQTSVVEDKVLPIAIYVLYLLGFATGGLTAVVGLIIAYVGQRELENWRNSHYAFAIWTFWLASAALLIAGIVFTVSLPLLLVLVGIIPLIISSVAFCVIGVWFAVRSILGLVYAAKGEPYPRPRNLLV